MSADPENHVEKKRDGENQESKSLRLRHLLIRPGPHPQALTRSGRSPRAYLEQNVTAGRKRQARPAIVRSIIALRMFNTERCSLV
ncbi:MAG: hypothetical protein DMF99_27150 [Acidobacteria bacterium]|nr:MAG: hypothetical protein DMF99_27150 [Acidobacteriota bacterium]